MKINAHHHFLQSDFWFKILAAEGERVFDLSGAKVCAKNLPLGYQYYYSPRGPILPVEQLEKEKVLNEIFSTCLAKAKTEKLVFWRLEPNTEDFLAIQEQAKKEKLVLKKTINLQPQKTLILDLTKDLEILTKELSQKTRYNIRLAEKKGVKIFQGSSEQFPDFWRLMKITGERDNFGIHGEKHYQNLVSNGGENIQLWFAQFEEKIIAAGIFCFAGEQAVYLHGASDNQFRNLMAPHLLQWEVIKEAKKRGCLYYDFYGIDEIKWPGVTRFKNGFGGEVLEYPGTYDLVFDSLYYSVYQKLRTVYRKFRKIL